MLTHLIFFVSVCVKLNISFDFVRVPGSEPLKSTLTSKGLVLKAVVLERIAETMQYFVNLALKTAVLYGDKRSEGVC